MSLLNDRTLFQSKKSYRHRQGSLRPPFDQPPYLRGFFYFQHLQRTFVRIYIE